MSEIIKKLRFLKGYNQTEIAKKIGMSSSNYSRKEKGYGNFTIEQLKKIADVLDVTVNDLIYVEGIKIDLIKKENDYRNR